MDRDCWLDLTAHGAAPGHPTSRFRNSGSLISPNRTVGGTVTGAGKRLKQHDPSIRVYAAEPEYGDLVYGLRNLDEGYVPEVLDQSVLDSRIKVNSRKALAMTRRLAAEEGIFAGVSTGASLVVAVRVCKRLPEGGWKYLSTGAYAPGDSDEIAERISGTLWA